MDNLWITFLVLFLVWVYDLTMKKNKNNIDVILDDEYYIEKIADCWVALKRAVDTRNLILATKIVFALKHYQGKIKGIQTPLPIINM